MSPSPSARPWSGARVVAVTTVSLIFDFCYLLLGLRLSFLLCTFGVEAVTLNFYFSGLWLLFFTLYFGAGAVTLYFFHFEGWRS